MKRTPKSEKFQRFGVGENLTAKHVNHTSDAVERLAREYMEAGRHRPAFKFMRLDEVLGQFGESDSQFWNQEGVAQYFKESDHLLHDTDPEERKTTITNPWPACPFDDDQIVLCVQTSQSGVYMPVAPVTIRHAITVADSSGSYPACGANVYPIKFTKKTFAKVAGYQSVSTTYLDTFDTRPDDFVLNIYDGETSYLPIGTEVTCYFIVDSWFTNTCCGEICESSSSSSASVSSSYSSQSYSSQSSSSRSSSSASSKSSSSKSSASSSESSQSDSSSDSSVSQSQSSSASSASSASSVSISLSSASSASASSVSDMSSQSSPSVSNSSGGSSASISASASLTGSFTCVDVITGVSFDENTCTLTWLSRPICFPDSLGITIGAES